MIDSCSGHKEDGSNCGAPAIKDSQFCLFHDPARAEDAKAARIRGGLNRRAVLKGSYPGDVSSVPELLSFLNKSLQEAWQLESGERRLNIVAAFLRIAVDVISLSDLDGRLQFLEGLMYKEGVHHDKIS